MPEVGNQSPLNPGIPVTAAYILGFDSIQIHVPPSLYGMMLYAPGRVRLLNDVQAREALDVLEQLLKDGKIRTGGSYGMCFFYDVVKPAAGGPRGLNG